jgi:hypothetical protein
MLILIAFCLKIDGLFAQYEVKSSTFANSGGLVTNSNYQTMSTLGQPFVGTTSGAFYQNQVGFWYAVTIYVGIVQDEEQLPKEFDLSQNYPNPFNPVTKIKYAIPQASHVRIEIYNVLGQRVSTLVNEEKVPGYYTVDFDAGSLASGFYIYRLQASGGFNAVKKMIVTK